MYVGNARLASLLLLFSHLLGRIICMKASACWMAGRQKWAGTKKCSLSPPSLSLLSPPSPSLSSLYIFSSVILSFPYSSYLHFFSLISTTLPFPSLSCSHTAFPLTFFLSPPSLLSPLLLLLLFPKNEPLLRARERDADLVVRASWKDKNIHQIQLYCK